MFKILLKIPLKKLQVWLLRVALKQVFDVTLASLSAFNKFRWQVVNAYTNT